MIGVKVLPNNYLWVGGKRMSRRNILLNVSFNRQPTRSVKNVLLSNLGDNIYKKAIVYPNTTSSLDQLRTNIERCIDMSNEVKGGVLVIQGDL